jgi:hypothetical protein
MNTLKLIPGCPGYKASSDGKIWSNKTNKFLCEYISQYGYSLICLYLSGSKITKRVSRLILEAFVGPCPDGMEACHINGKRNHNHIYNLRWDTPSNNQKDAVKHGTHVSFKNRGENSSASKLTKNEVDLIRHLHKLKVSNYKLAKQFKVDQSTISLIVNYKRWKQF